MAKDIFQREVDIGQPLAADAVRMLVSGLTDEDMLAQNVRIEYRQNISRLWEVGSAKTFFVAGRTEGTMTVGRIIGGKGISTQFIKEYGDVCTSGKHITLTLKTGCSDAKDIGKLTASNTLITSLAYAINARELMITEDLSMMFSRLEA